jgi:branched-chain amino acid transport system permease protein
VALGLVMLTGVSGMTSFGQAAFVGLGAYSSAYLCTVWGLSPWIGLVVGLVICIGTAYLLGYITLGLSGHYLPLCTIAWGISLFYLFGNMEFLGKFDGITSIPAIDFLGFELSAGADLFVLIWCTVVGAFVALHNILHSRSGRVLRALKSGVLMAESCGINTMQYKLLSFVLAAVLAAVSGWLYAHLQRAVNPTPFNLSAGIGYLIMAVVGGVGYLPGAVVGAALITLLNNWLQNILPNLLGQSGNYEVVVSGVLLIALLQKSPSGVWSWVMKLSSASARGRANSEESTARASESDGSQLGPQATSTQRSPTQLIMDRGLEILSVQSVEKSFGGLKAVDCVSFKMQSGQILGLIGPNGAGKSTMFNLISGVLPLSGGEVNYLGQEVHLKSARHRSQMGMARSFQHVKLIPGMSVLDNVLIGAHTLGRSSWFGDALRMNQREEAELQELAIASLAKVGLDHLRESQAANLSLGQQRLLEIARALVSGPNLLLLDEPAAGLRHFEKLELQLTLIALSKEACLSILIVEHDMNFLMGMADQLVVMDFGKLIAQGSPEQIRSNPRVIEAYLGTG